MAKQVKELPPEERAIVLQAFKRFFAGKIEVSRPIQNPGYHNTAAGYSHTKIDPCPDGTKLVFEIKHKTKGSTFMYGAAYPELKMPMNDVALIIDLNNKGWPQGSTVTNKKVVQVGGTFDEEKLAIIREHLTFETKTVIPTPPPFITIDWPDYGIIPAYVEFWQDLVAMLPPGKVIICCQGGKGRTGTALAAIWMAAHVRSNTLIKADDAIKFVRKVHHTSAVESKSQENYLLELERDWAIMLSGEEAAAK